MNSNSNEDDMRELLDELKKTRLHFSNINTEVNVQVFVTKTCHRAKIFNLIFFNTPTKTLTNVLLNENRRCELGE